MIPTLLAGAMALASVAQAAPTDTAHERAWRAHDGQVLPAIDVSTVDAPSGRQAAIGADKHVVGYLPYWTTDMSTVPWESLTRLSWFAVGTNAQGGVTSTNGWGGANVQSIVDTAHGYGIEVLLTFTLFDNDAICALSNSPAARRAFVDNAIAQINLGDADGISVDFETPGSACMDGFESLIGELSTAFRPRGWIVDIAMPAVDWGWGFDYAYLANTADTLFIMGYNYHWSGGNPGPVDPLYGGGIWGPYSIDWTVQDYLAAAGADRDRIILGLPTYGISWATTSAAVPGTAADTGDSIFWTAAHNQAATHGASWDSGSVTPYVNFASGGQPQQTWYQDVDSMSARFDYAAGNSLGGVGFWALGYDGGDADLWAAVDHYSGSVTTGPTGDLVGYIREGDIFEGPPVVGAVVTLSDGTSTTVDDEGFYQFIAIPAGITYTVTASADCYTTVSDTRAVEAGITNWKSIALDVVDPCTPSPGCDAPVSLLSVSSTVPGASGGGWLAVVLGSVFILRRRGGLS